MTNHYFSDNRNLKSNRKEHSFRFLGFEFKFTTDTGVFSKSEVDFGTWVLLDTIKDEKINGMCLDLGSGYGVVSVVLNKVFPDTTWIAAEVNPRAVELAKLNSVNNKTKTDYRVSDVYSNVPETFDYILTNPPIRAGKAVIYKMFDEAIDHLNENGELWVVIRKQQGAQSAKNEIEKVFGNCEVVRKEKGYFILKAKKV